MINYKYNQISENIATLNTSKLYAYQYWCLVILSCQLGEKESELEICI